ncbi:MAG: hypothetical protein U0790_11685 [Isosphaeraceae bacterium]
MPASGDQSLRWAAPAPWLEVVAHSPRPRTASAAFSPSATKTRSATASSGRR